MPTTDPSELAVATAKAIARVHDLKNLPKPEQLKAYADRLPDIYRDVLAAFAESGPVRTEGDRVAASTVKIVLLNRGKTYSEAQVEAALGNLVEGRFLNEPEFVEWFAPTAVGEALIATITGKRALAVTVPPLPPSTW